MLARYLIVAFLLAASACTRSASLSPWAGGVGSASYEIGGLHVHDVESGGKIFAIAFSDEDFLINETISNEALELEFVIGDTTHAKSDQARGPKPAFRLKTDGAKGMLIRVRSQGIEVAAEGQVSVEQFHQALGAIDAKAKNVERLTPEDFTKMLVEALRLKVVNGPHGPG